MNFLNNLVNKVFTLLLIFLPVYISFLLSHWGWLFLLSFVIISPEFQKHSSKLESEKKQIEGLWGLLDDLALFSKVFRPHKSSSESFSLFFDTVQSVVENREEFFKRDGDKLVAVNKEIKK